MTTPDRPDVETVNSVLVVGASLAGSTVATALREDGFTGRVTVVGDEPHLPYDRPPLSKAFLQGSAPDPWLVPEPDALDVDWVLGTPAVGMTGRSVELADGREVSADVVVIATGARARTLLGADDLRGVHTLRTLDDAAALRSSLATATTMVVIGAGFIGAEVASTAAGLGISVTIVEASTAPLSGPLGLTMAEVCVDLHRANGVTLLLGAAVDSLEGRDGAVTSVLLGDGTVLPADVVVIGIGSIPNTEWAAASGLAVDGGFVTDAQCRTTVPGVYAIGDCARAFDEVLQDHHRSEHWSHAVTQARRVARSIVGAQPAPSGVPYFWSDQYGSRIQFAGRRQSTDSVRVVEGDPEAGSFVAVYERADDVVAVLAMNNARSFTRMRKSLGA
ncbi:MULTISPECIES: NAD(P)/FAD-dependent oxidoreductase [unclassified Rhodococcus (in: high G+C Gram-positive bacteria)]|uniref:NAD(P)/FAD-dependent oxidoreductase n=1 Tax=unclassified Rhodococcus (in: high G+C Gram-positive bacteria) TaxID=192944 RepID=UPI0006F37D93|nr:MULTISPECIES: FAD-dependent oxidoreductase [unclassified Rhodococcus (in: high G+C Gram-positive bacteria)]KQU34769.1 pyridine nucleotide-disulfide oxidoreductase [Rhodococcus sp. Leaf225]KQU45531.1 pyridine nucleotide-disulfide oxidoreductase [Rhodococcus sp. Leaf258]